MILDHVWGTKIAMVVVDVQRKFTLTVPDWEQRMVPAVASINRFADLFRSYGAPVIFIRFEGKSHCDYDKDDADEWLPGIEVRDSDIIVSKRNMSCFKNTNLYDILSENGIDSVLLAGMLTEFCVASTYFGAAERDIFPCVAKDGLISYDAGGNKAAEIMLNVAGMDLIRTFLAGEQPEMTYEERRKCRSFSEQIRTAVPKPSDRPFLRRSRNCIPRPGKAS